MSELKITIYIPRNVLIKNDADDTADHIREAVHDILENNIEETGDLGDIVVTDDGWM